jgi:hypothetical protein
MTVLKSLAKNLDFLWAGPNAGPCKLTELAAQRSPTALLGRHARGRE